MLLLVFLGFNCCSAVSIELSSSGFSMAMAAPRSRSTASVHCCRAPAGTGVFNLGSLGRDKGSGPGSVKLMDVSGMVAYTGCGLESTVVSAMLVTGIFRQHKFSELNMSSILLSSLDLQLCPCLWYARDLGMPWCLSVVCIFSVCISSWCIATSGCTLVCLSSMYKAACMSPAKRLHGLDLPASRAILS